MRICITRSERHAYSETFIRDQIDGFSQLAEVFTIHSGRLPQRSEDGSLLSPWPYWVMHKIVKVIIGRRNNYFSNYGLKKFFQDNRIDVVLANYGLSASHLVPICRDLKIPLLAIFHGHDATDKKLLRQYAARYKSLFSYAHRIVVVSQEMKDHITRLGADACKIQVVPCGVDIVKFKPSLKAKEDLFVAVGRFVPKKGPMLTIQAFYEVWKNHPEARLVMIGSKEGLFEECNKLVLALGLQDVVTFPGVLRQGEISKIMKKGLAFVQHSLVAPNGDMEGTPVSILEASASGLPVISTLHGGIKDAVVHGKTGYLVEEGDVSGMASYMNKVLEDYQLAAALGREARHHIAANYSQDKQIEKLNRLAVDAVLQSKVVD